MDTDSCVYTSDMFILLAGGKQIRIVLKQIRDRVQVSRPRDRVQTTTLSSPAAGCASPLSTPATGRAPPAAPVLAGHPSPRGLPLSSPAAAVSASLVVPVRAGCPYPRRSSRLLSAVSRWPR